MPTPRPLPASPNLDFARKEAKALLRRLRTGDAEALAQARAQESRLERRDAAAFRLADAQLVIAREHGFSGWPLLVRYIGEVERQRHGHTQLQAGADLFEYRVRELIAMHRERRPLAARQIAAYVPRFYGSPPTEVFSSTVTEDEARLAIARSVGAPSWKVLLQRLEREARSQPGPWEIDPFRAAAAAIRALDMPALQRTVEAHPQLLDPSSYDISSGRTLMSAVLGQEQKLGLAALRPFVEWLEEQGFDRQLELNRRLCGEGYLDNDTVRSLLDRGADPNWVAPSGIPVLEHALLRYWRRAEQGVDILLAAGARPRRALWIAAGTGDLDRLRACLDARGRPTAEARRLRPDFLAVGRPMVPSLPDADDEEILLEALFVAMLNHRGRAIEFLARRGAPLNSVIYGVPLVTFAVGNVMTAAVEVLVRCGADLDLRGEKDLAGGGPPRTARELAAALPDICANGWEDARVLHVVELCGLDPEALRAERDARPTPRPRAAAEVLRALGLARDDALRAGAGKVGAENLLLGLLRACGPPLYFAKEAGGMDVVRFRAELGERLEPAGGAGDAESLPLDPEAESALREAAEFAAGQRYQVFEPRHLLHALTRSEAGAAARLLSRYGADVAKLHAALGRP